VPSPVRIVGSILVHDEDLFVEQAIRNAATFCDRIHAFDHVSNDRTWEILRALAGELDHLDVRRTRHSADAHAALARYAGTPTWILGIDGDELYDPAGLARLREQLLAGAHTDVFRLKAHVLNCDELDRKRGRASGWLAPPSRPVTKLFNYCAVRSWPESPDPLQGGDVVFSDGYHWESRRDLAEETTWADDPLRLLHVCFLRRSSRDPERGWELRFSVNETLTYRRDLVGAVKRVVRRSDARRGVPNWKNEWYRRGERVTVDATPFL
jgi:hypothetical protein